MARISIDNEDELKRMLERLDFTGPDFDKAMGRATLKIAKEIQNEMQQYPGPSNRPVKWASRKQQIWYFAARAEDGLPLEYTRKSDPWSQRLQQSWGTRARGDNDAVVGSRATYSPWVQSSELQQPQHEATGWITDEEAVKEVVRTGVVSRIVIAELETMLGDI